MCDILLHYCKRLTIFIDYNCNGKSISILKYPTIWIRRIRLNLDITKMIIFKPLFTTFEVISIFWGNWGSSRKWLDPKIKSPNQDKLAQISGTMCLVTSCIQKKLDDCVVQVFWWKPFRKFNFLMNPNFHNWWRSISSH